MNRHISRRAAVIGTGNSVHRAFVPRVCSFANDGPVSLFSGRRRSRRRPCALRGGAAQLFPVDTFDVTPAPHLSGRPNNEEHDMAQARRIERESHPGGAHPPIVSSKQWLDARKMHLSHEKEFTKHYGCITAERRRLPMVKIDKNYMFDAPSGKCDLKALFNGRRQLIIYHFMFDPAWEKGCPNCTWFLDALGDLSMPPDYDTTFALVSRTPLAKIEANRKERGWNIPWYSTFGTDFNYDFHVTNDSKVRPPEYSYRTLAENKAHNSPNNLIGEEHGLSVFFSLDEDVFHTCSAYGRGAMRMPCNA
jgi:predicted dithiol-disulfide oxidoreductase (DUF899 family)